MNITPMGIIREIAGSVPVEYDGVAAMRGGGYYDNIRRVIKLSDPAGTSGHNLLLCAHEAFHARRHREGVRFYSLPNGILQIPARRREEEIVNDLAEAYVANLLLTDEQRAGAAQILAISRANYTVQGQIRFRLAVEIAMVTVRLIGLAERRQGKRWTTWDACKQARADTTQRLNAPGILVADDGTPVRPDGVGDEDYAALMTMLGVA